MIDFIEYIVNELRSKRLTKENALSLIKQFSFNASEKLHLSKIHPLLHCNISDLSQQCYYSEFTGDEFFLKDHQFQLHDNSPMSVLPGVAYLEMARAAIEDALPKTEENAVIELRDIFWAKPITVENKRQVYIVLFGEEETIANGQVEFEIFTVEENEDGVQKEVIHCQGKAGYVSRTSVNLTSDFLKNFTGSEEIGEGTLYSAYAKLGMHFGPAHKSIKTILKTQKEVMVELVLPDCVSSTGNEFRLHPSLMDGAMQAALALIADLNNLPEKPAQSLPFGLRSLHLYSSCKKQMRALIRFSTGCNPEDSITRMDVDLFDLEGNLCVTVREFSSQVISTDELSLPSTHTDALGNLFASYRWEKIPAAIASKDRTNFDKREILLCGFDRLKTANLESLIPASHCLQVSALHNGSVIDNYNNAALACFDSIKKNIATKASEKTLFQVVIQESLQEQMLIGLSGLFATASMENPAITGQILLVNRNISEEDLAELLSNEMAFSEEHSVIKYSQGVRHVLKLKEIPIETAGSRTVFKDHGVYVITGGLGGLGVLFTTAILREVPTATIVLTGRSDLTIDKQVKLDKLAANHKVIYKKADLTDSIQAEQLFNWIKNEYKCLNGIIHSAGVIADNFIQKKSDEEFLGVLSPKVAGTINLDLATEKFDLDFMVLFSSGASVTGNPGQADYATANGFMDFFAMYRNQLVTTKKRHGRTVAINWPLWLEGGMNMEPQNMEMMRQNTGMHPMETKTGIEAFSICLLSNLDQVLVAFGDLSKLRMTLIETRHKPKVITVQPLQKENTAAVPSVSPKNLELDTEIFLKKQFSEILKLPVAKIDASAPLERYGIDSIMAMNLTNVLEKTFGTLSKTLFFEFQTIQELAQYFVKNHLNTLNSIFTIAQKQVKPAEKEVSVKKEEPSSPIVHEKSKTVIIEFSEKQIQENIIEFLRKDFSGILKLAVNKIDPKAPLEKYGIDSILAMNLTAQLEKTFGTLPKTLFFEYQNILDLTEYFIKFHAEVVRKLFASRTVTESTTTGILEEHPEPIEYSKPALPARRRFFRSSLTTQIQPKSFIDFEPIAVVGLSGAYPESPDLEKYWFNLRDGKDCIREVPSSRWDWRDYYSEDRNNPGHHYSKWGGFIEGVDEFDPKFFNISPREAIILDPQERIFLQQAWKAIEDAGYTRASLQIHDEKRLLGQVGVYVGVMYSEYQLYGAESAIRGKRIGLSGSYASIANRVSYFLNLHGPSMTLDTMCSSSLTAIHLACQDLKLGRTKLAIAGGVNVSIHPNKYLVISSGQFISNDGHCQSFGIGGDGYIPGEGVGAVVLKKLSEAIRDGNHIYGIIKGSALNHGGKTNGYSVPNPQAQSDVIHLALAESQVNPRHISYIEAHGTGTKLGDPIEIASLTEAFRRHTGDTGFCLIGSVKSNVGHCESAAGIAGLTKVLLQLKHKQIVPSLHSKVLNPYIDFKSTPFIVNQELRSWDPPVVDEVVQPRIAGLSSFGAGGSNAHLIIQEYIPASSSKQNYSPVINSESKIIIPLSARTENQLMQKALDILSFLQGESIVRNLDLHAIAFTLQLGRESMEKRVGFLISSIDQLKEKLQSFVNREKDVEGIFEPVVSGNQNALSLVVDDNDFEETLEKWFISHKTNKLLELWVNGYNLDWNKLYREDKPSFVSLPTYPFAKERYWIDIPDTGKREVKEQVRSVLHPLIHVNTSDMSQQSYTTVFTGDESFLQENRWKSESDSVEKTVPSEAFLEMARVAVSFAIPDFQSSQRIMIRDVVWGQSSNVSNEQSVITALFPNSSVSGEEETIDFEIFNKTDQTVFCQGQVELTNGIDQSRIQIDQLKSRTDNDNLSLPDFYNLLAQIGYIFQSGHLPIKNILKNSRELLVTFSFSDSGELADNYQLSILEGVFKASIVLLSDLQSSESTFLIPAALDLMNISNFQTEEIYAWIRISDTNAKLDIDICDKFGNVFTEMRGLTFCAQNRGFASVNLQENIDTPEMELIAQPVRQKVQNIQLSLLDDSIQHSNISISLKPGSISLESSQNIPEISPSNQFKHEFSSVQPSEIPASVSDTSHGTNYSYTTEQTQQILKKSLAEALYMQASEIDIEKSFIDLGLDSIIGVEWVKAINKKFNLDISATKVYDYSNVKSLSIFIKTEVDKRPSLISSDSVKADKPVTISNKNVAPVQLKHLIPPVDSSIPYTSTVQLQSTKIPSIISIEEKSLPNTLLKPSSFISEKQIQDYLKKSLADALYLKESEIDNEKSFVDLGLDSIIGVEWVKAINKKFKLDISATKVYDYATIKALAAYIKNDLDKSGGSPLEIGLAESSYQEKPQAVKSTSTLESRQVSLAPKNNIPAQKRRFRQIAMVHPESPSVTGKIAIIGMSGRYPQAPDLERYWDNLQRGKNSIVEIPSSRWDLNTYYDPVPGKKGKMYCKWLGALEDVDCFDPLFFQINPAEAEYTDPQHRIFLQESYKAFEDAGYSANSLSNQRCGVYLGIMSNDYSYLIAKGDASSVNITGNSFAIAAGRVAYLLNLKGPAIPFDTACSSSLVAIHVACQGLLNHETDMALAGGVTLYLVPEGYLGMCQAGMLSPQGQCKAFDDTANGFVPGEGVGAVVLKRLEDAQRDHDHIYGVILGSGINQDGKTNGITAPSVNSQIELERNLYEKLKISPESISYIETHGTGTKLGDPIELEALSTVFKEKTSRKNFCGLGSVKTNIGHTSAAAGVASLQKVLLSMSHKMLVPSLNMTKENSIFDLKNSPFYISKEAKPWETPQGVPRRAAVSAFGFSGTNAHLVIEEYLPPVTDQKSIFPISQQRLSKVIVPLSARTEAQLQQKAKDLLDYIRRKEQKEITAGQISFINESIDLYNLSYTLQVGRDAMKERLCFLIESMEQLEDKLQAFLDKKGDIEGTFQGKVGRENEMLSMFDSDDDLQKIIGKWISEGNYEKLIALWVKGFDLDWNSFYASKPYRINLPTYPFVKERYWVNVSQTKPVPVNIKKDNVERSVEIQKNVETIKKLHFTPRWISAEVKIDDSNEFTSPMLILGDTDILYEELKNRYKGTPTESALVFIKIGNRFESHKSNEFEIDPSDPRHLTDVFEILNSQNIMPRHILHHVIPAANIEEYTKVDEELNKGVLALFTLCKILMKQKSSDNIRMITFFSSVKDSCSSYLRGLGAFYKTINLENPRLSGKVVEIQESSEIRDLSCKEELDTIINEFKDQNWYQNEIRYKVSEKIEDDQRLIKELSQYSLDSSKMDRLPFKQKGVYIVSGGLGGLGYRICEYLAANFHASLALIGRSEPGLDQKQKIEKLRASDARVEYFQGDIVQISGMESIFANIKSQFKKIDGVIHCAGINRDSFVINKSLEDFKKVIEPKVIGTISLDLVTAQEKLDFFVMFSSVAGAFGNPGQSDYAFGNNFLDSFAEYRDQQVKASKRSGKSLSINWPYWQDGGMKLSDEEIAVSKKHTGLVPLPTNEGLRYCEEFLLSDYPQGIALYGLPSKINSFINSVSSANLLSDSKRMKSIEPTTLLARTVDYLKGIISAEIKLSPDRIDQKESFDAFGIDSIIINRINGSLENDLGTLSKTLLYEYNSIEELAKYLTEHLQTALLKLFNESAIQINEIENELDLPVEEHASVNIEVHEPDTSLEAIAIIGLHGYFPHSENMYQFWENLKNGRDLIDTIPPDRWDYNEYYDPDPEMASEGKIYCKWGGFIDNFDKFDPQFFSISPEEARNMDPQERLFLQSVWAALEDASYTRDSLKRLYPKANSADVGVFAGVTTNSYHLLAPEERMRGNVVTPGSMPWSIANRVSYFFDLQGPSIPVDTACSSSLVAIHLACESLRKRECRLAIAGGVNLYLHPYKYQSFCRRKMLALNGRCRSYGAGDDGFVPGEGVGTIILKPLTKAIADRDNIYAVIAGSGYEHAGRSNGYSAPNPNAQAALIAHTLKKANVHPETIGYIEGHGTGTQMGDGLEIVSLTNAFNELTDKKHFCPIGSVKSNMGHAEAAAGIAGIAKIILQLQNKQLVPTLHSDQVNPDIDLKSSPFYLQHTLEPWLLSPENSRRRALINSFGAGGVNACLVLEEFPTENITTNDIGPCLFVLSAKNVKQLKEYATNVVELIQRNQNIALPDLTYTFQVGRESMFERLAIITSTRDELVKKLELWNKGSVADNVYQSNRNSDQKRADRGSNSNLQEAIDKCDLQALASLWVSGLSIDWDKLYNSKPRRISLSSYPFAKERYWISDTASGRRESLQKESSGLHPLIAFNSSTLKRTVFTSQLSINEFYALDHVINGQKIFPGSAFLEIACVAGDLAGEKKISKIKDVVWAQPLVLDQMKFLQTQLESDDDEIKYSISSISDEHEKIMHSEGRLQYTVAASHKENQNKLDLKMLINACPKSYDGSKYYEISKEHGFNYGPSFQSIQKLYINDFYAISKIKLADSLKKDFDRYLLHPCLIDGALQTVVGLLVNRKADVKHLPFAIEEIEILRSLPESFYAYAELAQQSDTLQEINNFTIYLVNEYGDLLIAIKNFYVRSIDVAPIKQPQLHYAEIIEYSEASEFIV